jgi:alpha-L-fucosidase
MRSFISFSITPQEQHIVSYLAGRLHDNGFKTDTNARSFNAITSIDSSHVFLGIVSSNDIKSNELTLEHWQYALSSNLPSILLVEKELKGTFDAATNAVLATKGLWFERKNPRPIVHIAQERIEKAHKGFVNLSLAMNEA